LPYVPRLQEHVVQTSVCSKFRALSVFAVMHRWIQWTYPHLDVPDALNHA